MDIAYIREFVVLAETGKFSAAARELHISQSTLSRHIQSMEDELGHLLFTRTTREMKLSEYGAIYLPHAKKIVQTVRDAMNDIYQYEKHKGEKIKVGIVHYPELYYIIDSLMDFQRAYPQISVNIVEGSLKKLYSEFSAERLNVITNAYSSWEQVPRNFIRAGESRLAAIMSKDHPLASMSKIPLHCLDGAQLIVPENGNIVYKNLDYMFRKEGIRPNIFYQGNSSEVSALLLYDMNILIQDRAIGIKQLNNALVLRELEPSISYVFGLEYSDTLSDSKKQFVKFIRKRFEQKDNAE